MRQNIIKSFQVLGIILFFSGLIIAIIGLILSFIDRITWHYLVIMGELFLIIGTIIIKVIPNEEEILDQVINESLKKTINEINDLRNMDSI